MSHTVRNICCRHRSAFWSVSLVLVLGILNCSLSQAALPDNAENSSTELAARLVEQTGINRGICMILGRDGDLPIEVARTSELLVYVREARAENVTELRRLGEEAGLGIQRLVIEQGGLTSLPFADNVVDAIISTQADADILKQLSVDEVLRVLRPAGKAIIGNTTRNGATKADLFKLTAWAKAGSTSQLNSRNDAAGNWVSFSKPIPAGIDDWSHWEKGPDNNPVSSDSVIKAPYMTQFMAKPYYIPIPSITTAAGGRTFLAIGHIAHHKREWGLLNTLIARNGYNGTILWQRKLPDDYLVHRSAFIATRDTFYMLNGDHCLMLDPETGEEQGQIRIPDVTGEWKWMAMKAGVLHFLVGEKGPGVRITRGDRTFGGWSWADLSKGYYAKPRVPWGFGSTLVAYDLQDREILWKHTEKKPIDSRALSIGKDRVSIYCPDLHFRCLDLKTGKVLWTNEDRKVLDLIEAPGRRLRSTPGFRSACLSVFTPDAIVIQGQTRMNVVALSPVDGYLLWTKKKVTNNPNAIFVDGNIVLGVGEGGSHVVVDPRSGKVIEDLGFKKVACTRLTACGDSFFVRGEGTLRFDRDSKKILIDGAVRPACNDGVLPAHGLLYLGPWQCDCNLSLIGNVARCSAGEFKFDHVATESDRLQTGDIDIAENLELSPADWPTYRGNIARSSSTIAKVATAVTQKWLYTPRRENLPGVPTAAGGLVFTSGHDGKVRAIASANGQLRWEFATPAPITFPPTISGGRAFVGSGDGFVYALEAATGRLLWKFRAAPIERHIKVYDYLSSTWPVNSGVLIDKGTAYFACGIIDHDGTYVYALDAATGKIKWQNNSSGHLNQELRKGVSVQGNLTIHGNRLLLAGGNQISPAPFDLETGECLAPAKQQGRPQANNGQFLGVFRGLYPIAGGRILYSASENVSTKGSFSVHTGKAALALNYGGIAPAWSDDTLALVNFQHGTVTCIDADKAAKRITQGYPKGLAGRRRNNLADAFATDGAVRWQSVLGRPVLGQSNKFEAVSLAVCPNAIVSVLRYQQKYRAQPQWYVVAFNKDDGKTLWQNEIREAPLPGGLLVDRDGQVIVTMLSGNVLCLAQPQE